MQIYLRQLVRQLAVPYPSCTRQPDLLPSREYVWDLSTGQPSGGLVCTHHQRKKALICGYMGGGKAPDFAAVTPRCTSYLNKISQFITVCYSGGNIFRPLSPLIRLRKRLLHQSPTFTTFSQLNFQQRELEAAELSVVAAH